MTWTGMTRERHRTLPELPSDRRGGWVIEMDKRRLRPLPEHGTVARYHHAREPCRTCDACREAHAAYQRNVRAQNGFYEGVKARRAAVRRLMAAHPEEFAALLAEERADRLPPK